LTPKIKTQEVEVFFEAHHKKCGLLSRKQACPKGMSAKRMNFLESFGKIETPRKGQNASDTKKAFRGRPRKDFLGRDEFFQRIFLHKSQAWVIVGG